MPMLSFPRLKIQSDRLNLLTEPVDIRQNRFPEGTDHWIGVADHDASNEI
jgi:hypothetical protein